VTEKHCRSTTTTSFSPVLEAHQIFSLMSCCAKPSHNMLHWSRGLHLLVTRTKAGNCSKSTSMRSNSHFWRQKKATKTMNCSKSTSMQSNSHKGNFMAPTFLFLLNCYLTNDQLMTWAI
jgi:hypothetical protein